MRSLYGTLGIDRRATRQEIKRAYYQAAHDCHPDKCPDDAAAAQRFRDISLAYTVLGNAAARRRYDLLGPMALGLSPAHTDLSIFGPEAEQLVQALGSVFGGVVSRLRRKGGRTAPEIKVPIDVATALRGGTRELRMERTIPCPSCQASPKSARPQKPESDARSLAVRCSACGGQGTCAQQVTYRLRIPSDTGHGDLLRMGKAGSMGQDLLVRLQLDPHPLIRLRGLNLYVDFPLRPSQAVLGGEVTLQMPHTTHRLTIAPGAQPGDVVELPGAGLKGGRGKRGSLFVALDIEVPKPLTPEARQAWQALADAERGQPSAYVRQDHFARGMLD